MNRNLKHLRLLASQLAALRDEARALGLFVDDRDLLTGPRCGLVEDVAFDGQLISYHPSVSEQDSGLRFKAITKNQFRCPACRCIVRQKSPQKPARIAKRKRK